MALQVGAVAATVLAICNTEELSAQTSTSASGSVVRHADQLPSPHQFGHDPKQQTVMTMSPTWPGVIQI